jgi:hypothetical protein
MLGVRNVAAALLLKQPLLCQLCAVIPHLISRSFMSREYAALKGEWECSDACCAAGRATVHIQLAARTDPHPVQPCLVAL